MNLTSYRTLGRSGLVVSPMALGTMTFGTARWGADADASRAIFDAYVDAGGNFVDTADIYAGGRSEELVGRFVADRGLRERIVLGTKFTWNQTPGNPNAGGNGRKNIHRALDASLARLATDHVDLYWLHFWDMVTPANEVLQTLTDLVRAGKVRYWALSDVPSWYLARIATLAQAHGVPGPVALQTEYSLVERAVEWDHAAAARECGVGIAPWSPLAGGFLAGKYRQGDAARAPDGGRLAGANPFGDSKFSDRNWAILDVLRRVAAESGHTPADVALAWTLARPGVASLLIGASRPAQLQANVQALGVALSADHTAALDATSAPAPAFPWSGFSAGVRRSIFGGADVQGWR